MASAKKAVSAAKRPKAKAKPAKPGRSSQSAPRSARGKPDVANADPALFDPLTTGEAADALRTLTEDRRMAQAAKVGRYRVIASEPLVVKPPHWMAGHRLARVVAYDYAADRALDACVDLDAGVVAHLDSDKSQPMLSREEEAIAQSIAVIDPRVREQLTMGDVPMCTMHYWGRNARDLAYARRSAAVLFGRERGHASLVVVVDLIDRQVTQVVPAEQW